LWDLEPADDAEVFASEGIARMNLSTMTKKRRSPAGSGRHSPLIDPTDP